MDNGKPLGIMGDNNVKSADFVSGDDPFTIMEPISSGNEADIQLPMLIFNNATRYYPIRGVEENIPGVCNLSSPKGLMDSNKWLSCISVTGSINILPENRQQTLFVDIYVSHVQNGYLDAAWLNIHTTLCKLPLNAT